MMFPLHAIVCVVVAKKNQKRVAPTHANAYGAGAGERPEGRRFRDAGPEDGRPREVWGDVARCISIMISTHVQLPCFGSH
jgi:hypothetical protein